MTRKIILLYILIISNFNFSQNKIQGYVLSNETKQPIAFANVIFNNNPKLNTITDIDGKFLFTTTSQIKMLSCSYVGYEKADRNINDINQPLVINLQISIDNLKEILVSKSDNKANKIIKKVIEYKAVNNPENITTFQYKAYNKVTYDLIFNKTNKLDSLAFRKMFNEGYLFLTESVSEKIYIKPNITQENIIATKVSGFKNPKIASLETDLQPFSFYNDNIKLLEKKYLNPISNGSITKYDFFLEDQIYKDKDTVFIISYKPKKNKNFDGLKGFLYINSNKYAIQNVIASPNEKGAVNLKIQQQYQLIENKYWFPEKLNYELVFGEDKNSKNIGIIANGKSYIKDVKLNIALNRANFKEINLFLEENAGSKNKFFWDDNRIEKLNEKELSTYKIIDSIGKKYDFDFVMKLAEKGIDNKFPTKYFDVDLSKTFIYNQFEGSRIGTGVFTNELFLKKFVLGGYLGYGLKDKTTKSGVNIFYEISKKNEVYAGYEFNNNLIENGAFGLKATSDLFNFRTIIGSKFSNIIENKLNLKGKNIKYLTWNLDFTNALIQPLNSKEINDSGYVNTAVSLGLRYAFKEKFTNSFGKKVSLGTYYPTINLYFSKGFNTILHGELNYQKIQFNVSQSFFTKNIGQTSCFLEIGLINKTVPKELLFTGYGYNSGNNLFNFYVPDNFQTMFPYEFSSDKFVNLFLTHDFGTLILQTKWFKPSFVIHNNFGWGNLSKENWFVNSQTNSKIYLEAGLQLNNLIKIKIDNLGYLGIGTGVFYRYGHYSLSNSPDNIISKLTINYSIN